jgi:DNA (cytosine-5)-methyltransferase 1
MLTEPDPLRVLDLFAGGYGAAEGYRQGGATEVVCVDFVQRRNRAPGDAFTFIKADVRDVLEDLAFLRSFDLIHASPPCKVHTRLGHLVAAAGKTPIHGDLVDVTRQGLERAGVPYIIENVEGAPLRADVVLCGTMFGLTAVDDEGRTRWLRRHRLFELGGWGALGWGIQPEPCCSCQAGCRAYACPHRTAGHRAWGLYGSLNDSIPDGAETPRTISQARDLIGMPWADWDSITQAIPPAYTRHLIRSFIEETRNHARV